MGGWIKWLGIGLMSMAVGGPAAAEPVPSGVGAEPVQTRKASTHEVVTSQAKLEDWELEAMEQLELLQNMELLEHLELLEDLPVLDGRGGE